MGKDETGERARIFLPYSTPKGPVSVKQAQSQNLSGTLGIDVLTLMNHVYDGMDLAINLVSLDTGQINHRTVDRCDGYKTSYPLVGVLHSAVAWYST
jgi:hypothetical protein